MSSLSKKLVASEIDANADSKQWNQGFGSTQFQRKVDEFLCIWWGVSRFLSAVKTVGDIFFQLFRAFLFLLAGDAEIARAARQLRHVVLAAETHGGQPDPRSDAPVVHVVAGDGCAVRGAHRRRPAARSPQGTVQGPAGARRRPLQVIP